MRVYVIRHGQSEYNVAKRWSGWADIHLTERGRADAAGAGRLLEGIRFDKIYASDLSRAQETAQIALPGCEFETSPLLREINVGTMTGRPWSDLSDAQRAEIVTAGYVAFAGESQREFYDRVLQFRQQLEGLDCENVAVFAHAGWLVGMLNTVMELLIPRKHLDYGNCTIGVFDYVGGVWKLHSWISPS